MLEHNMETSARITVKEIIQRLRPISKIAVYTLLERGEIPAVRLGRNWIITRRAYDEWERTCGMVVTSAKSGLSKSALRTA